MQNPSYPGDTLTKINILLWRSQAEWLDRFVPNQSSFFRDFVADCMKSQTIPDENIARQMETLQDEIEFHIKKKQEHEEQLYKKRVHVYSLRKNVDIRQSQDMQHKQAMQEHEETLMRIIRDIPALYRLFDKGNLKAAVEHLQAICETIPQEKIYNFFRDYNEQPDDSVIFEYFREWVR